METTVAYGLVREIVQIPDNNLLAVAQLPSAPLAPGGDDSMIRNALQNPVGTKTIREMAVGKQTASILISDHTRTTPSRQLIPPILEELKEAGIPETAVNVIIAPGLHEPPDEETILKMLGTEIVSNLNVMVHNPDDDSQLVDLGQTDMGTVVKLNKVAVESDFMISLSTIEPHGLYGFSGGAKNIIPGISARETVYQHHGRVRTLRGGLNRVEGNTFRADAEEAAEMCGLNFILNVVFNEHKQLLGVFGGHPVKAHRAAIAFSRSINLIEVPQKADIVISSIGGAPRDRDFWQGQGKGHSHTQHLVREEGVLILAAGCADGVGAKEFKELLLKTPEEIMHIFKTSGVAVPLMKAASLLNFTMKNNLFLVTPGLKKSDLPHLRVTFFPNVSSALKAAFEKLGSSASVLVVPNATKEIVMVKESSN